MKVTPDDVGHILLKAASDGNHGLLKCLIAGGADANFQGEHGHTPLMMSMIGYLAQPKRSCFGDPPYHDGHMECFRTLSVVSDVGMRTKDGVTAFMFACRKGRAEAVATLLPMVDLDETCRGKTALEQAERNNDSPGHDELINNIKSFVSCRKERAEIEAVAQPEKQPGKVMRM